MEMDYYDYNVINASAAPGSYLGMDPAFLVWIPPIDESGKILSDSETDGEEIFPVHSDVDPESNKESPEEDEAPRIPAKPPRKSLASDDAKPISSSALNPKEILAKINFLKRNAVETSTTSIHKPNEKRVSVIEKETSVIKSPSDSKISEYYELSDIKFADDEDEVGDTAFEVKS